MAGKTSFRGELLDKDLKEVREPVFPAEGTVVCKGLREECAQFVQGMTGRSGRMETRAAK